jgi:hypothetical protein
MVIALLLTVCVAMYLALVRVMETPGPSQVTDDPAVALRGKLTLLLLIVLCATLLILMFAIGAYLLLRAGRAVSRQRLGGKPTEYVDAWSQYRLSDEQIEAATREEERPRRPGAPPRPPADEDDDEPGLED